MEETEDFLKQFDYKYLRKENELVVIMEFSQRVSINFSDPKKVVITDKLIGWNFLTGMIHMSIKKALLFNLILGGILSYSLSFINTELGLFAFFVYLIWIFLWSVFYLSKSENLKDIILNWNS